MTATWNDGANTWDVHRIEDGAFVVHPAAVPDEATAIGVVAATATALGTEGVKPPMPVVMLALPGWPEIATWTPAVRELARRLTDAADIADRAVGLDPEEANRDG